MSAHTPAPWKHTGTGIEARAFDGSWKWITPVVHGGTPAQATANLALMVAAPEMREVLLMIQALRIKGRTKFMLLSDGAIMQAVEAVLAKTEGGSHD